MIVVFGSINADLCFRPERCPVPGETLSSMLGTSANAASIGTALSNQVERTLGAAGAETFGQGELVTCPGHNVDVADTTAAGDCFTGVLAAELVRKLSLHEALPRAIAASALACTRQGSQSSRPNSAEINAFLKDLDGKCNTPASETDLPIC